MIQMQFQSLGSGGIFKKTFITFVFETFNYCPDTLAAHMWLRNKHPDRPLLFLFSAMEAEYSFRTAVPPPLQSALLAFSLAIWDTLLSRSHLPRNPMAAGIEIAEAFIPLLQTTVSKPRKPRNRSREKREFEAVLRALPSRCIRGFTDGSSQDDQTRAGAGYTFFNPLSHRRYYSSLHLGLGSNNAAELVALSRIFPHLHDHLLPSASPRLPVQIFVDSKYAINVVEGKWQARSNRTLVTQAKMALAHLRSVTQVHLFWVPSHSGIYENDIADLLAEGITSTRPPSVASLKALDSP